MGIPFTDKGAVNFNDLQCSKTPTDATDVLRKQDLVISTDISNTSTTSVAAISTVKSLNDRINTLTSPIAAGIDITINTTPCPSATSLTVTAGTGITLTPNITAGVCSYTVAINATTTKTALGLGTAAYKNTGTTSGTIPILDAAGRLPSSVLPPNAGVGDVVAAANNTLTGVNAFTQPVIVAAPTAANHAVRKVDLDNTIPTLTDPIFTGTAAAWNLLTDSEKANFKIAVITP